jgi:hypothetical protein
VGQSANAFPRSIPPTHVLVTRCRDLLRAEDPKPGLEEVDKASEKVVRTSAVVDVLCDRSTHVELAAGRCLPA